MINRIRRLRRKITKTKRCWIIRAIINFKFQVRFFIGYYPLLFYLLYGWKWQSGHPVHRDTEIVIEGFPGSANTFFVYCFYSTNPIGIGHHLHVIAQIKRALRYRIPIVILIRPPLETVVPWMSRSPNYSASILLKSYIKFYTWIYNNAFSRVLFTKFETYTNDINLVIKDINVRFNKHFKLADNFDELKGKFLASSVSSGVKPDSNREKIKSLLKEEIKRNRFIEKAHLLYSTIESEPSDNLSSI